MSRPVSVQPVWSDVDTQLLVEIRDLFRAHAGLRPLGGVVDPLSIPSATECDGIGQIDGLPNSWRLNADADPRPDQERGTAVSGPHPPVHVVVDRLIDDLLQLRKVLVVDGGLESADVDESHTDSSTDGPGAGTPGDDPTVEGAADGSRVVDSSAGTVGAQGGEVV